ncbi:2-hydroxyacid dehydrogenase [Telmatospirillum sp.]|uniref:2-hydroxyacid dehydrogenase n=1 Tax=Telmatospirillum sp. TaxID=2079197 RepID=UPI00283C6876|nr:2-hydroxyacid dehydrogenase [Telmatospirillum sp.]MDR3437381.1 2-hydroxyacid dehydrogenase [Telmatospirillum sp.]
MKIVFHGANSATYLDGLEALLSQPHQIERLPDILETETQRDLYRSAEMIVSSRYDSSLPPLDSLRLFQVPGAGLDGVDMSLIPMQTPICNCYGHEIAIGEYVLAAMLRHTVPLNHADQELRKGEWAYWSARPGSLHGELAGRTIGIVGYGHIGKHIARLADVLGMRIIVANRSAVPVTPPVSASYSLTQLEEFCRQADFIVCCLPHIAETASLLDAKAFAAMQRHAVVINVGRGPVIDEDALYDALSKKRIGGAVIDTWYVYPPAGTSSGTFPGHRPFQELDNITLSPHMSGWTVGMMTRRRQTIATNIEHLMSGQPLVNCVRKP